ncbi:MAG: hypothetical protein A2X31_00165 [Elusimicrobia bacterium GWB2_63_22]|nr:MAG: hypothetical protein A2X31_00165 [Elusimicrobia bacterium GWB2_63_22]
MRNLRIFLLAAVLLPLGFEAGAGKETGGPARITAEQVDSDLKTLEICRAGLRALDGYVRSRAGLYGKTAADRIYTREEKEEVWGLWKSYFDYLVTLDRLGKKYGDSYDKLEKPLRQGAFLAAYGAFMAQYSSALTVIEQLEKNGAIDVILNEDVPEAGIPKGSYFKFKFRFLNAARAAEFVALEVLYAHYKDVSHPGSRKAAEEDAGFIWKHGRVKGQVQTLRNAMAVVKKAGFTAWFPVQTEVSEFMGDAKVYRRHSSLITQEQIARIAPLLEPGDIFLERREWYLSNVGLPGFWPHAALYVGGRNERDAYFSGPEVVVWAKQLDPVCGSLDCVLKGKYPEAYETSLRPYMGHAPKVLEAMSEGVTFTSLEHSLEADSIVVLRPRLPKTEKAQAILKAFHYSGRPYDFNFDFQTDDTIVCSELVYKCYEPSPRMKGIRFETEKVIGRHVSPPNLMAKQFDVEYGTDRQQLDMILFLDGREWEKAAKASTLEEFRRSWKRPKWYIWQ